jgi:glycine dehydrogenase
MIQDNFITRHNGPSEADIKVMLSKTGASSLDELISQTIPSSILKKEALRLPEAISEHDYLKYIREIGKKNKLFRSFIGMGYYNTITLPVVQRNILENPSWYTSYTPYQAEISQGRLTALLNYQTMVIDLTGMEIANASLLDEATAAAEAMIMMYNCRSREAVKEGRSKFFVDENVFPQTFDVMHTRAIPLGIEIVKGDYSAFSFSGGFFGSMLQYPDSKGEIRDYRNFVEKAHSLDVLVGVAADLMSLVLLCPPGEWDADIVVGSSQRFGVPLGYGGPHAAFFACKDKFKRNMPGRIIGISVDRHGNPALRMALQTREQHIKREKATSNICTAQALLATMAGMYGVYHGPEGLTRIAKNIHFGTKALAEKIAGLGYKIDNKAFFDTIRVELPANIGAEDVKSIALGKEMNFWYPDNKTVSISLDETIDIKELNDIIDVFARVVKKKYDAIEKLPAEYQFPPESKRKSGFMSAEVFHRYRSETDMMRYIKMLERKDISLTHSMISLGSCTMKLNAASEMMAFLWPEFSQIHPFVPLDQVEGYQQLFNELGNDLKEITGFDAVSFQPNSGAAGEYAGLMVIRAYHESRGESSRNIVLIPSAAHGTNPASAAMAGMEVVVVDCDDKGNTNIDNLKILANQHKDKLAGFMITYPSTHGVFEESVKEMIDIIHQHGGQVYMDGANMNAQVGLTNPSIIGADVCHLNLHKTFAIPHGGGGPGVGPIAVASHLVEFLPSHPVMETGGVKGIQAVSAAPYGSASILTISHAYIKMLGAKGLTMATKVAILNANYLVACLKNNFQILYTNEKGRVAHEMILDCRSFKPVSGITETDIAKRLMDYGFHAPTLSFPVHGTLMIEPTESESKAELDRFIESMNSILGEINEVCDGKADKLDNVLKNAPHTAFEVSSDGWKHPYLRHQAAYPLKWIKENKFWPSVARLDDAFGDRNLICSCAPTETYKN